MKIYRRREASLYFVGRYSPDGRQLRPLAQFAELDALITYCLRAVAGEEAPWA